MGIFDKYKKTESKLPERYVPKSEQEAWNAILFSCILAGGKGSEEEFKIMLKELLQKQLFQNYDAWSSQNRIQGIMKELNDFERAIKLVEGASSVIPDEDKLTVFAMACEYFLSKRKITDNESSILQHISKCFNISSERAEQIFDVIKIKNKGNIYLI